MQSVRYGSRVQSVQSVRQAVQFVQYSAVQPVYSVSVRQSVRSGSASHLLPRYTMLKVQIFGQCKHSGSCIAHSGSNTAEAATQQDAARGSER